MKKTVFMILILALLAAVSVCCAQETAPGGDKSLYDKAYKLYERQKYYEAHEMFIESQYGDWERMAKKCVRRWPKNGQLWYDTSQWLRDTQLTFKVEQPEDTAVYIEVYKDGKLFSQVFVGGTDEITIGVPGNQTYTIKDGVGSDWFGPEEAFGPVGAYETMLFTKNEKDNIYLEARYNYMITINVEDAVGEPIGSEDELWEDFSH